MALGACSLIFTCFGSPPSSSSSSFLVESFGLTFISKKKKIWAYHVSLLLSYKCERLCEQLLHEGGIHFIDTFTQSLRYCLPCSSVAVSIRQKKSFPHSGKTGKTTNQTPWVDDRTRVRMTSSKRPTAWDLHQSSRGRRCDAIGIFYIPRNRKVKRTQAHGGRLPYFTPRCADACTARHLTLRQAVVINFMCVTFQKKFMCVKLVKLLIW